MNNTWSFIYIADIQPGSPKSFRFNPAYLENWQTAMKQIKKLTPNPELILVGGDLTRDGLIHKWELLEMKAELDSLKIPYHAIPGNMDVGNKVSNINGALKNRRDIELNIKSEDIKIFESVFGDTNWSFVHKNVRFSGFCDMLMGSNLPEEKELWEWLEQQTKLPHSQHHIWLMHYALFINNIDEPNFDITNIDHYLDWYFGIDEPHRSKVFEIFKKTAASRVMTGHIHCRKDHIADGIHFDLAPGIAMGQWGDKWPDGDDTLGFFLFEVNGDKMIKHFIPLEKVSKRTDGYGKGGHTMPEARDYSLAWEKIK